VKKGVGALFLLLGLAACGGGGGDGGDGASQGLTLSPASLSFSAPNPQAATPPSQTITATLSNVSVSGTLFVRVEIAGPAVASVTGVTIVSSTQGTATVNPRSPASLGPGTHQSVITVKMCTTDPGCSGAQLPGSPKTLNVSYQVDPFPPPPNALAPSVATANVAGELIIRGAGFVPGTLVFFGASQGGTPSMVSDTEIRASYPALPAGVHPVSLQTASGMVPFGRSLAVVEPPAFATTSLTYPAAPHQVRGLVYDPVAKALLVSLKHVDTANNQLLRYGFESSAWQPPASATIADLRDIALSLDGATLFAVSEPALLELNPGTLVIAKTSPRPTNTPFPEERLKGLAVANDGNVVVTTGLASGFTGSSLLYLYSPAGSTFTQAQVVGGGFSAFYHAVAGAPANGAYVNILQGFLSPAQPVYRYNASARTLSSTGFPISHGKPALAENGNVPAYDRAGSRTIVPEATASNVPIFDMSFQRRGELPAVTVAYAVSPDAQRAYALTRESGTCSVRAYTLAGVAAGSTAVLTEITNAITPATITCPTTGGPNERKMIVTPADDTAFIAGELGIAVVRLR
jgi:hypothetical protein